MTTARQRDHRVGGEQRDRRTAEERRILVVPQVIQQAGAERRDVYAATAIAAGFDSLRKDSPDGQRRRERAEWFARRKPSAERNTFRDLDFRCI